MELLNLELHILLHCSIIEEIKDCFNFKMKILIKFDFSLQIKLKNNLI